MYNDPYMDPPSPAGGGGGGGAGWIGALVQLGGSLYDNYQNRKTAERNTDATIAANMEQAALAYQRQVMMWHMQNKYNSPEQQMARFGAAGLNPHLIYGQGNAGNASSTPSYNPPNIQYRYEAPQYGAAFASVLPMLMQVGSWMQSMRKSEIDIEKSVSETDRVRQLVEFLQERNPQVLREADNKLSLYPYQYSMQRSLAHKAWQTVQDLQQEYRYKYGHSVQDPSGMFPLGDLGPEGGMRGTEKLIQLEKLAQAGYNTKLLEAKSSWSDFDVTDPQGLMMLVLNGVMGLAGQTLRLSTHRRPKATHEVEERMSTGRIRTRRRIYE